MRKRSLVFFLAATVFAATTGTQIPAGVNQFAAATYRKLAANNGNIIFSPFNISTALSMAMAGARGKTATEMASVLHQANSPTYPQSLADLVKQLNAAANQSGDELSMANGLWVQKDYPILPAFSEVIRGPYGAPLTPLDFVHAAEAARSQLNSWASEHTRGKIKDLFGPGSLTRDTRLVIASAIYFHGKWSDPFKPGNTSSEPFHLNGARTVQAKMMHQTEEFQYGETPSLQVLEMGYADQALVFDVLLPKSQAGLADLEKSFTAGNIATWMSSLSERRVEVTLPKFRAESEFELSKELAAMGMASAFRNDADFSGIDGRRDLMISQVVHKAYVDVAEEGTEAAAATGITMMPTAVRMPVKPVVFRADHPFLFLIRHKSTGVILFAGRLVHPT